MALSPFEIVAGGFGAPIAFGVVSVLIEASVFAKLRIGGQTRL
jgi:hypothetical protein